MKSLRADALAAWWAAVITALLQCGVALTGLSAMLDTAAPATALVAWAAFLPPVVALQALHTLDGATGAWRRWRWVGVMAQAALTYLPVLAWGVEWPTMAGFAAGSAYAVIGGPAGAAAFAAVTAASWPTALHSGLPHYQAASVTVVTGAVGLVASALLRMAWRLRRMDRARDIEVRAATHQERARIARDLHDLVASRLTMATMRGELAVRHLEGRDERAHAELRDTIALTREALTDLRSLGQRIETLSLSGELEEIRGALTAAGVQVKIRWERCPLPSEVENMLAMALREAVTNLLRHSEADVCRISVRRESGCVVLRVANDGVPRERPEFSQPRRGLSNLSLRAGALGGSCTTAVTPRGWFLLTVACPVGRHGRSFRPATPLPGRCEPHRDGCAPRAS